MRFCSINIHSGERHDGSRKKKLTGMLRDDSDCVVDAYLKSFKYYNNGHCISLNIACDEEIDKPFIEPFCEGYPILHIPFDLESYQKIQADNKNDFWLKVVNDSIRYVSSVWGWDDVFFDDVYNKCVARLEIEAEQSKN